MNRVQRRAALRSRKRLLFLFAVHDILKDEHVRLIESYNILDAVAEWSKLVKEYPTTPDDGFWLFPLGTIDERSGDVTLLSPDVGRAPLLTLAMSDPASAGVRAATPPWLKASDVFH